MSNMVTRCPQCQTSFKVTEEHLKIANGAVRCGSCLHVFQARQNWVNPDNAPLIQALKSSSAVVPEKRPEVSPPGKFQFDQSAIDSGSADNVLGKTSANLTPPPASTAPPPPIAPTAATPVNSPAKKLETLGDDDRISDDLDIGDDEQDSVVVKASASSAGLSAFGEPDDDYSSLFDDVDEHAESESFDALLSGDFNDLDELVSSEAVSDSDTDSSDDSWAADMLAEMQQEEQPESLDLSQVENINDILMDFTNPVDVDAARRDLGIENQEPFAARELGSSRTGSGVNPRAEMISHIEPPPVDLLTGMAAQTYDWKSQLFWGGISLSLVLLLAMQHLFFNFEKLAKADSTRGAMQTLCGVLMCQLPAVENARNIKISNLIVRKHPQVADALAVDAILLNVTNHEQRFPQIELDFSNMEKLPVASRRFEPAEYLLGEMSGQTLIPSGRPVHIALEIVAPPKDAVNWSLQVVGKTD